MKEHGILFKAEMVRAILSGQKTQTRRIVKHRHDWYMDERDYGTPWPFEQPYVRALPEPMEVRCPYGKPEDRLWVRETWHPCARLGLEVEVEYRATESSETRDWDGEGDIDKAIWRSAWRPSLLMPRWASRIDLNVTVVRVERLNDISEADAIAEGCASVAEYRELWERINGAGSWAVNPWVWVVGFARVAE